MFDHAAHKVAGDAGVKVSRAAGENVDAIGAVHFKPRKADPSPPFAKNATGFGMTRERHNCKTFKLSMPRSSITFTATRLWSPNAKGKEMVPRYFSIRLGSISALRLRASLAQPSSSSARGKKTWRG